MASALAVMVDSVLADQSKEGMRRILGTASQSSVNYEMISKSAVHYAALGNPDNLEFITDLIMELERLESQRPELKSGVSIVQRLTGPLGGVDQKDDPDVYDEAEKEQHMFRALMAESLLFEIAAHRPVKVLGALLQSMQYGTSWSECKDMIDIILDNYDLNITYNCFECMRKSIVPSLERPESKESAAKVLSTLIEKGKFSLSYLAGALLAAARNDACREECLELLEQLLEKNMGCGDPSSMTNLLGIISATIDDPKRSDYSIRIAEKLIEEERLSMMRLLGPIMWTAKRPGSKQHSLALLGKMKEQVLAGRLLGDEGPEMNMKAQSILYAASTKSPCPKERSVAKFFMDQMKMEGTWNTAFYEHPKFKVPLGNVAKQNGRRKSFNK